MSVQKIKTIFAFVSYLTSILLLSAVALAEAPANETKKPADLVTIETSMGNITLELFTKKTPETVANFKRYVSESFYDGTVFHRVIPGFMIQGGGFNAEMQKKATHAAIKNEAQAFIPNQRGTIAMARTNDPHSATSQFFINVVNNRSLNRTGQNFGYAVFGKVIDGMDVVDAISQVPTTTRDYMRDVPQDTVLIKTIKIASPVSGTGN